MTTRGTLRLVSLPLSPSVTMFHGRHAPVYPAAVPTLCRPRVAAAFLPTEGAFAPPGRDFLLPGGVLVGAATIGSALRTR